MSVHTQRKLEMPLLFIYLFLPSFLQRSTHWTLAFIETLCFPADLSDRESSKLTTADCGYCHGQQAYQERTPYSINDVVCTGT